MNDAANIEALLDRVYNVAIGRAFDQAEAERAALNAEAASRGVLRGPDGFRSQTRAKAFRKAFETIAHEIKTLLASGVIPATEEGQAFIDTFLRKHAQGDSSQRAAARVGAELSIELRRITVQGRAKDWRMTNETTNHGVARTSDSRIRLFLCHSSRDAELAKRLVKLLQTALALSPDEIRCTSVIGYKLPGGADTDDELRKEAISAEAFVGLVSPASVEAMYVSFELGARWGSGKRFIPIMARGMSRYDLHPPLGGKNALEIQHDLEQLITDAGNELGVTRRAPETYRSELDDVLAVPAIGRAPATATGPPELPKGFALHYGIVWRRDVSPVVPYCEGCRTGSDRWVGLSVMVQGAYMHTDCIYICPHGHPPVTLNNLTPLPQPETG